MNRNRAVNGIERHPVRWLVFEAAAVVIWKLCSAIGHALAEILLGRQP